MQNGEGIKMQRKNNKVILKSTTVTVFQKNNVGISRYTRNFELNYDLEGSGIKKKKK